ncbi:putative ATP-dependent RNA helicase DDX49 [Stylophora pistillata]|uniref:RNA helicase n=2 Tax=Stylophora pistillata TaxID=50429 RepID=A0A2B4T0J4_STYPI|nr:putative ATP-dependent RNA helicase DDX49 [Stylophora pistillata]
MADDDNNDPTCTFSSLGLNNWLVKQCNAVGIKSPTEIQQKCVPPILSGRDCIGCAKTGSGKTAAFALPILQRLCEDPYGIFAVILTPTRELAYQICDQFRALGKPIGLKEAVIIGGLDMMKQSLILAEKPHVIIATPGRLADHLKSTDTFDLKKIKFLVLDEADRLLDPSFSDDLQVIFDSVPTERQTLLFSATLTDTLQELREISSNDPFYHEVKSDIKTVTELDQRYILASASVRDSYLIHILREREENKSVIVFTHTCKNCQTLANMLWKCELPCVALHSLKSQGERLAGLATFKSGIVKILVATDVASRGLDIPQVELVINSNVPASPKDYIHRVGRTARAGRGGMAITLVTQYDVDRVKQIEATINTTLVEFETNENDVLPLLKAVMVARREAELRVRGSAVLEKRLINKRKKLIQEGKDPDLKTSRRKRRKYKKEKN